MLLFMHNRPDIGQVQVHRVKVQIPKSKKKDLGLYYVQIYLVHLYSVPVRQVQVQMYLKRALICIYSLKVLLNMWINVNRSSHLSDIYKINNCKL